MSLIKVSAKSRSSAVAGAIVYAVRDHQRAELLAVGEEALNQALKAVDVATLYLRQQGSNVLCVMEAGNETIVENEAPAIRLIVELQNSLDLPDVVGP